MASVRHQFRVFARTTTVRKRSAVLLEDAWELFAPEAVEAEAYSRSVVGHPNNAVGTIARDGTGFNILPTGSAPGHIDLIGWLP